MIIELCAFEARQETHQGFEDKADDEAPDEEESRQQIVVAEADVMCKIEEYAAAQEGEQATGEEA
jgi:hypothetical protein